jgi:hypothetical protein
LSRSTSRASTLHPRSTSSAIPQLSPACSSPSTRVLLHRGHPASTSGVRCETLNPPPSTLHPQPQTLTEHEGAPASGILRLHLRLEMLNPKTINPTPSTLTKQEGAPAFRIALLHLTLKMLCRALEHDQKLLIFNLPLGPPRGSRHRQHARMVILFTLLEEES